MLPIHRLQQDLFEEARKAPILAAAQRNAVVGLIEELLIEALAGSRSTAGGGEPATREAAHEQDHA